MGPQEALFIELTRQSGGGLQLISFIRVSEPLSVESVFQGFKYLHARHPFLRARVVRGKRLRWICDVDFSDIPIQILPLNGALNFEDAYAYHGMTCLDSERCIFSLTLYTNHAGDVEWIVVVNIHAAFDGRAIMTLFLDLDKYLCSHKMPASIPSLPLSESIAGQLEEAGFSGGEEFEYRNKGDFFWPTEKSAAISERRACATSYSIPLESIQQVIRVAKKNQIRLTAFYGAVAILASRVLPVEKNLSELIVALDARQLCSPPISFEHVGPFSQTANLHVPSAVNSMGVIDLARYLQSQINSVLLGKIPLAKNLSTKYSVGEISQLAYEISEKDDTFSAGICISNVGNMKFLAGRMHYFEIERGMVTQNNGINPFTIITYTTYRSGVFILGYCEPLMSKKSVYLYIDEYEKIIRDLVSGE
ncbi:hypothetical protein BTJ40_07345 [Microbulbifer sp. A4B17]|nr:hypothetical protein BTJ40_07345 [Microbulbifer sp. A4B17]